MLTARQTLLHYLSLIGILISIAQVFVFYAMTGNAWISTISVFFSFLFIIVNILNAGKFHELAKIIFVILSTSSLTIWALFLPNSVEISIYFIPLSLVLIKLYDFERISWALTAAISICIFGMITNFFFEGVLYESSFSTMNFQQLNHIALLVSFFLVIVFTILIIKDTRKEDNALFESKEKLMAIYNSLTTPMIFINRNFEIHWFNKKAESEFELYFNQSIKKGKKIEFYFSKDYIPKFKHSYDLAISGEIVKNQHVYLQNNISKIYYEYVYIPVFDKFNEVIGVVLQMMNTTTKSTIENELTQQKMMLEEVYNQSPDALFLVSLNTEKIIFYNNTAKELFVLEDDSSFVSYKQLFNIEDKITFWTWIEGELLEHDFVVFEEKNKKENNELFIGETRIKKFEINGVYHLLVRISDISEKVAQRELKFSMLEMERKNAENLLRQKNLGMMIQGQEEERQRISKDLHDGIGQMLTAIRLEITSLEGLSIEEVEAETKIAKMMIDNTIHEVKRISNNLMPSAIVDLGLIPALKTLLVIPNKEIKVNFEYDNFVEQVGLTKKQEITIYRIVQESLNNALKYAGATRINLEIKFIDVNNLLIQFTDDGIGFDIFAPLAKISNGLMNMRERASLIDAKFEVISEKNKGTIVLMIIPFNNFDHEK